jgi:hypothetical protein
LNTTINTSRTILHEVACPSCVASPNKKTDAQFCVSVDSYPRPNVAKPELAALLSRNVLFLGIAEIPDFVALDALAIQAAHGAIVKFSAGRSDFLQQRKNRAFGYAGHPAGGPNRIALAEGTHNRNLFVERESVHGEYYA